MCEPVYTCDVSQGHKDSWRSPRLRHSPACGAQNQAGIWKAPGRSPRHPTPSSSSWGLITKLASGQKFASPPPRCLASRGTEHTLIKRVRELWRVPRLRGAMGRWRLCAHKPVCRVNHEQGHLHTHWRHVTNKMIRCAEGASGFNIQQTHTLSLRRLFPLGLYLDFFMESSLASLGYSQPSYTREFLIMCSLFHLGLCMLSMQGHSLNE